MPSARGGATIQACSELNKNKKKKKKNMNAKNSPFKDYLNAGHRVPTPETTPVVWYAEGG